MITRHALNCRMLRARSTLANLPPPRWGESTINWLVRVGLADTPQQAAEGLLVAAGLHQLRDELLSQLNPAAAPKSAPEAQDSPLGGSAQRPAP